VKFFQTDPLWDIFIPPDKKFVFDRSKKKPLSGVFLFSQTDPVWNIF